MLNDESHRLPLTTAEINKLVKAVRATRAGKKTFRRFLQMDEPAEDVFRTYVVLLAIWVHNHPVGQELRNTNGGKYLPVIEGILECMLRDLVQVVVDQQTMPGHTGVDVVPAAGLTDELGALLAQPVERR